MIIRIIIAIGLLFISTPIIATKSEDFKKLEQCLKNCKLIIDHDGAWKKYNLKNNYHLSGDRGWI